jgi:hypothetical protein
MSKTIEHRDSDLYSTWDVTTDHYCINITPRKALAVFNDVKNQYEVNYPALAENVEYFSFGGRYDDNPDWPLSHRIAVFYVEGGSEGYYVHVETLKDGKHKNWALVKTLREGETGIKWAEQTANALSRIMHV